MISHATRIRIMVPGDDNKYNNNYNTNSTLLNINLLNNVNLNYCNNRINRTTSLMKLSWGVNGMAFPKQPQLRTHWFGISTSMPFSTMVLLPKGSQ